MPTQTRKIQYYNVTIKDEPGEAFKVLTYLSELGVNMQAFSAVPMGPSMLLTVFPDNPAKLSAEMRYAGKELDGPHYAILVQGDDEIGALASIHEILYDAGINVSAANGISDGKGGFGYVIFIRSNEFEKAAKALGI